MADNTAKIVEISPDKAPHLRIGLSWDPRESDYTKFLAGNDVTADIFAKFELTGGAGLSAVYSAGSSLLRYWKPDMSQRLQIDAAHAQKMEKLGKQFEADKNKPPYHLDLLCYCYDANKNPVEIISPYTIIPRNPDKATLSILPSGDNDDGVGSGDDEEISIMLKDVPPQVQQMFFVVVSHNYAFGQVANGKCHIVRAQDEKELLESALTGDGNKETFLFSKMQRNGANWNLQSLAEYIDFVPDEELLKDQAIGALIREKYV